MITEDDFVQRRRHEWDELDHLLASRRSLHRLAGASISRAAALYRALSTDLVRARTAGYSGETVAYLDAHVAAQPAGYSRLLLRLREAATHAFGARRAAAVASTRWSWLLQLTQG